MIKRVQIEKFKRFNNADVVLKANTLSIVVGGNNSGKSSLLQALSTWNYAKSVIIFYKDRDALNQTSRKDGVGISFDDFTPLNIPSFEYLWTNLKATGGYTLKIKVFWDDNTGNEKYLQIGFSLTQDRLYVKKIESNLITSDVVPEMAYLPPFAGITEKEPWLSAADRRKQIGRGLSGSVLRNLIYDYFNEYKDIQKNIPIYTRAPERTTILSRTTFHKLNTVLAEIFSRQLFPEDFSLEFQNYLKVPLKAGQWRNGNFELYENYSARDIMAEGRGFLQWISTFCLLFNSKIDVLLLDEPDAHLHTTLQIELIKYLQSFIVGANKQILIATHSSEVIKSISPSVILEVESTGAKYCTTETQVQKILIGLGVEHFPLIHKVQQKKKVVFTENTFDEIILKGFANKLNLPFNDRVVFWPMANNHRERKQVYLHLKDHIPGIKIISLEDKDNCNYSQTNSNLSDSLFPDSNDVNGAQTSHFLARKWRRWEMESYLINPNALAAISARPEQDILSDLQNSFSIFWPVDFKQSERTNTNAPLFDRDGKSIIEWFQNNYNFQKHDLPNHFLPNEIPDDIIEIVTQINNL